MMVWHVMRSMMRVAPLMRRAVSRRIRGTVRGLVWGVVALGVMAGPWGAAWNVANGAPERQTTTVDTSRFGIVEAYYRPDEARELGVGWERIVFDWARFQPDGPDQFEMEAVPVAHLEAARSAGREVVGLLKNVPNWASGAPETVMGEPPEGLDRPLDDPGNAWAAFVMRVVETYSEEWDIHHWIIFNEPDIRPGELPWHEFDGTVEDYYQLLKVGYLAAKLVDPDAVIHVGGMAWWGDVTQGRPMYLKRLLDVAARDPEAYDHDFFFDAVSLHVYFDTQNVWEMVTQTRGILTHYRQEGKPIWINEINARPAFDPRADVPPAMYDVSLGQQADFMVQAAALALAAGVERFAVYRLYDDHYTPGETEPWGLIRADGTRRPAYDAYRTTIAWFSGTVRAQRSVSDHAVLVTLEQADRTVYVMWARDTEDVQFHVYAETGEEIAARVAVSGALSDVQAAWMPGLDDPWFVVRAPAARPDPDQGVLVEGRPVILVIDGPPRPVWVRVGRAEWRLR